MIDYKPKERQELEELYRKQNVRINELEEENRKLRLGKERLEELGKIKDEIKDLRQENNYLKLIQKDNESQISCYFKERDELIEENGKLKKNIERYEKEETRYIKKIKNLEMIKKENESQISCYFKERNELREENQSLKELNKQMQENYNNLNDSYSEILEENQKLKEDNRFLTKISKEYMKKENIVEVTEFTELYKDDLEKENKSLKKENKRLMSDLITTIEERDNAFKKIEQLKEELGKLVMSKSKD